MSRITSILIILALLLAFCGCGKNAESLEQPASFYYMLETAENSIFEAEVREIKPFSDDYLSIANHYFNGPTSDTYVNVFPAGLRALSLECNDAKLLITVSDELSELSYVEQSITCACMGMTLLELTGCTEIVIRLESRTFDGKESITLQLDDLYLFDSTLTVNK